MRIGFDIDGVLANFIFGFATIARRKGYKPLYFTHNDVNTFDHSVGLTDTEACEVWEVIDASWVFWTKLPAMIPKQVWARLKILAMKHDVYFITTRDLGRGIKRQTEIWLHRWGIDTPTVLMAPYSAAKADLIETLDLHYYIDDSPDVLQSIVNKKMSKCCYALDYKYNRRVTIPRIPSVAEYLERIDKAALNLPANKK